MSKQTAGKIRNILLIQRAGKMKTRKPGGLEVSEIGMDVWDFPVDTENNSGHGVWKEG